MKNVLTTVVLFYFEGAVTVEDVSLFLIDQNNGDFRGIPDRTGEALERLRGWCSFQ